MSAGPETPQAHPGEEDAPARDTTPEIAAIFVENHRAFLAFLERRVASRAIAEDILQEAFVRGMGRLRADEPVSVVGWFYRTLHNAAVDHHRRHNTASKALQAFAAETGETGEVDPALRSAVCQCVSRLADTLKPAYAEALRRIEIDGASVKEYAAEAGISASNAAVRIFRAREALRQQLARSCGTCAEHGCLDCTCGAPGGATSSPHCPPAPSAPPR